MRSLSEHYLTSFLNFETQPIVNAGTIFHLKRIKRLLAACSDPQKKYPLIHVVGTKGKGSTAVFIATMLQEAGFKVGLYTSPHVYSLRERIRVLNPRSSPGEEKNIFCGSLSGHQLSGILKEIKPAIEKVRREKSLGPLTFFEVYTALALAFFAKQKVDVVVAEAGLGGRLDATNTAGSEICVFTSMSYDHTQVLGTTLKQIAQEKAAIIKSSTRAVFSAPQRPPARLAIEAQAKKFQLKVLTVGRDVRYQRISQDRFGVLFSLQGLDHRWPKLRSRLVGEHQVVNASLAAAVVEYFLKGKKSTIQDVVAKGIARARWPVRFEIVGSNPFVVVDSAHNEDSVAKLAQTVQEIFPRKRILVLFGASSDKDVRGMLRRLGVISRDIILTRSKHPRSFDFSSKSHCFLGVKKMCVTNNAREGLRAARAIARAKDVILVAGSVFLAGEIRALCRSKI